MTTHPAPLPPPIRILQLATSSWASAAVSAAAELGVADALADGPQHAGDLARAVAAEPRTLFRLLRACTELGLFERTEDDRFSLTETGQALRSDSAVSMRNFARWVGLPADRHTWSGLAESVRSGTSAFAAVHGESVWDFLRGQSSTARIFNDAMTEASRQLIAPVVAAYDFGQHERIVDVAGGQGALLAAILGSHPGSRGVLYDLPEVVENAAHALDAAGVTDRVDVVGGDIFTGLPPGADAYLLSNVIHDWDDEHSRRILRNCREAVPAHGKVLLVEAVMPDRTGQNPTVALMDLNMLVLCDGAQRTRSEFDDLLATAGLRLTRIVPAGLHSVVVAEPA
jgi:DNA-binding HxlR family transcriptional regulator